MADYNKSIGTSDYYPTRYPSQNKIVRTSEGTLVAFILVESNRDPGSGIVTCTLKYKTSTDDGDTWSAYSSNLTSSKSDFMGNFDVYIDSSDNIHLAYCFQNFDGPYLNLLQYQKLTKGTGDNWTVGSITNISSSRNFEFCSINEISNGNLYIFGYRTGSTSWIYYFKSTDNGSSWGSYSVTTIDTLQVFDSVKHDTDLWVFYLETNSGSSDELRVKEFDGTTWTDTEIYDNDDIITNQDSLSTCRISDDNIWVAVETTSGIKVFNWNGSTWDSGEVISDSSDGKPSMGVADSKPFILYVASDGSDNEIVYKKHDGTSWSSETSISSNSVNDTNPTAMDNGSNARLIGMWRSGDSADYDVYFTSIETGAETISESETVNVSDSIELSKSDEYIDVDESVNVTESNELINNVFDVFETVNVSDSLETIRHAIDIDETVNVSDSLYTEINKIEVDETVEVSDDTEASNKGTVEYASKILSYNPLLIVTDTNPAKIAEIDVTDPTDPTWSIYTLSGVSNANNITYNSTTDYIYAFCDDGKVIKMPTSNLNTQTTIDTLDTDNLELSDILVSEFKNYAGTDDSNGEIISIDEATTESISLDIRFLREVAEDISLQINTILGKSVSTDIRFLKQETKSVGLDIRFLKYDYDEVSQNPISLEDWRVEINGTDLVPLNDVDMSSISITHTVDEKSTATFILHRRFDDLDRDKDGNSSQITNQNSVKIYINGNLEFNGNVSNIDVDSEGESVLVTAQASESSDSRKTVTLPIPSVNEQIHLYHCLTESINIDNPDLDTRAVIVGDSRYWTGSSWSFLLSNAQIFTTEVQAQNYIDNYNDTSYNLIFDSKDPSVASYDDTAQYYKGVKIDLGTKIEENIGRWLHMNSVHEEIENGTFQPKQNREYFWRVNLTRPLTFLDGTTSSFFSSTRTYYIGTSLSPISSDVFEMTGAYYRYQRQFDDDESEMGYLYLGSPPYLEVSTTNGKKLTKSKWEDRDNGLYSVKEEGYDYTDWCSLYAENEYNKLKNINGDVLPISKANLETSLDAYYYYRLKLLTRINLSNTTVSGVYNNSNGFPTSIKTITISSSNMKVALDTDNMKSQKEIDELNDTLPEESDYITPGKTNKLFSKRDILSNEDVE